MTLTRFYAPEGLSNRADGDTLPDTEAHHLTSVLRLRRGVDTSSRRASTSSPEDR